MQKGLHLSKLACAMAAMLMAGTATSVQAAPTHDKNVIGYITQWEAWKGTNAGFSVKGEATHLNVNMDIYSILNFSFFGVAKDGSLHSGDLRNKNIYQPSAVQEPGPLLHPDVYSSWDFHILWGELEYIHQFPGNEAWEADALRKVQEQGFVKSGNGWLHTPSGVSGQMPIPLKKAGGAPGLIDLAHQKGVKVMASLGGWSMSKHFPEMAADPVKKARFLADVDKLMALGFDGIDIDWEYPGTGGMNFQGNPEDYGNFELLMEDIRERIGPNKLLTAAFSASTAKLEGYNWPRLVASMDSFNMMTYDLNGGWSNVAGHNAPLYPYPEEEYQDLDLDHLRVWMAAKGIPSDKINFGAAFYGRGVQTTEATAYVGAPTDKRTVNFSVDGPTESAVDLDNWKEFEGQPNYNYIMQAAGWEHMWDANAEVPYAVKGKYFLSYDDVPSIEQKAQYIVDNQLGGVIVWQVHGDIKCEGSFVSYGTKLKQCTNLSSPLAEAIDKVFSAGDGTVNTAPALTVPASQNVDAGAVISFAVSATDSESDLLSFTVTNATVIDNGDGTATVTYQAPNTATDMQDTVTVKVSDGRKSATSSVVINVKGSGIVDNTPPVLTAPLNATVKSGQSVVISVQAEDADGDLLTFTASEGSIATTATGADIIFTAPTVTVDTVVDVTVTVSDGIASEAATIAVTVQADSTAGQTTWDQNKVYNTGDTVLFNGVKYTAKWWTKGEEPGNSSAWEAFDDGSVGEWSASKSYSGGDQVTFNGQTYKAKWWTKGEQPGNAGGPWQQI
ncbi:glycosyl hydrolase family 18 protein [Photobacterium sp. ZSDE20]|uniref:chitinase n=1 Tax=Photobacterium pectinilyticum TaxID=2906793 RepID=A0ABT1N4T8_9GAMM|nr:glycosyl hydrolase family 18 protein [Photobacterium sp. ZSDE20]MCQ1059746.1 glycosyl hydrolase family 18 protein [Photobacterium sp. ZSDE20]MDD1825981.1 glycosyl hydrolase family 18 protein [Photobacterium sp. ZSDE20]